MQAFDTRGCLELGWGDVLPGRGDDDFLLPTDDPQIAIVVEAAQVTGAEPPVVSKRLGARVGEFVVPRCDDAAAHEGNRLEQGGVEFELGRIARPQR